MRKIIGLGVLAFLTSFMLGMSDCDSTPPADVELVILHTNDLHYHLHADPFDPFQLGGVARLSTLIAQKRAAHAHTLLLDGGDWSESSWYYNVDGGEEMLGIMAHMGFDAAVVGNHDYLNGPDFLPAVIRRSGNRFPILAANVEFSPSYGGVSEFQKYVRPSWIVERAGLKIGIIGLTNVDYPFAPFFKPARATDPIEVAKIEAKKLRPQVDLLILLSHNGFTLNEHIAKATLGVDVVVSGHSHHKAPHASLIENAGRQVPVVETGEWGKFLGELKLKINPKTKKVTYVSSELTPVNPSILPDPAVEARVKSMDERLRALNGGANVNEPVANADVNIRADDTHVANTADLATKGYRLLTGAQVSFEALALTHHGFKVGPISTFDIHEVQPHIFNFETGKQWTLKKWYARGSDLALIANILYSGVNLFGNGRTGIVAFDGMEVTWAPKGPGEPYPRVVKLMVGNEALQPGQRYTVALLDGMWMALNMANEQFGLGMDMGQMEETGIEGWRGMVEFASQQGTVTEAALRQGNRSYTTVADGALSHTAIQYNAGSLRVRVSNDGLQTLAGGKVVCFSGIPDSPITYDTPIDVWTRIGEGAVGPLEPGRETQVSLGWTPKKATWPVRCEFTPQGADGYAGNNSASTVFVLSRSTRGSL